MKKSRYTEEQIIAILKQHEAGVKTADLCREHGISAATFYGWKSKWRDGSGRGTTVEAVGG
jgi:putative transposase